MPLSSFEYHKRRATFAGLAMEGLLASADPAEDPPIDLTVRDAVRFADALIEALAGPSALDVSTHSASVRVNLAEKMDRDQLLDRLHGAVSKMGDLELQIWISRLEKQLAERV